MKMTSKLKFIKKITHISLQEHLNYPLIYIYIYIYMFIHQHFNNIPTNLGRKD